MVKTENKVKKQEGFPGQGYNGASWYKLIVGQCASIFCMLLWYVGFPCTYKELNSTNATRSWNQVGNVCVGVRLATKKRQNFLEYFHFLS